MLTNRSLVCLETEQKDHGRRFQSDHIPPDKAARVLQTRPVKRQRHSRLISNKQGIPDVFRSCAVIRAIHPSVMLVAGGISRLRAEALDPSQTNRFFLCRGT